MLEWSGPGVSKRCSDLRGVFALTALLRSGRQIADFGLSRVLLDASVSTGTYGTVTHMPPELLTTGAAPTGF